MYVYALKNHLSLRSRLHDSSVVTALAWSPIHNRHCMAAKAPGSATAQNNWKNRFTLIIQIYLL